MSSYDHAGMQGDDPSVTKLYGERTANRNCQYLLPYIKPTSTILDVGCGPGTITSDFAKLAPEGKVTGVDTSEGIITSAQTTFPPSAQENLAFAVGDAYKLEFPDNTFDIVHAHQVLVHLKDPVAALKEFHRVTKPGGLIAVRDSSPSIVLSLKPDLPVIRSYWAKALAFMPLIGGNVLAGQQLEGWAKEAGFEKVVYSKSPALNTSHLSAVTGERAKMALQYGMATQEELDGWRKAWEEWEAADGSEFVFEAGEILVWKGT